MCTQFNHNMLPILGVMWHEFASEEEALTFAGWAERETRNTRHPCSASITKRDDGMFVVRVRNW